MDHRPYPECPERSAQPSASSPKAYLQRDKLIFVCAAGSRSKLAAALGFKEVYNLSGGTQAWRAAGLEVVVPQQQAAG